MKTLPWLHSMVHAGVLFMMVDCKLLQVSHCRCSSFKIAVSTWLQLDVNSSMAESAFQVPTPSEQTIEPERETQWEEDTTQLKKFGRKPNPAKQNSTAVATGTLMRVDAPDFEWPQPWHHVWADQCLPSPAAAHYLIERTNKLWKSELVCSFCILRIFNASELT